MSNIGGQQQKQTSQNCCKQLDEEEESFLVLCMCTANNTKAHNTSEHTDVCVDINDMRRRDLRGGEGGFRATGLRIRFSLDADREPAFPGQIRKRGQSIVYTPCNTGIRDCV